MGRRVGLLLVAVVTVGLTAPVGSVRAAPVGPVLVANGSFESPDLDGWRPSGEAVVARTGEAAFRGAQALEVTSSGAVNSGVGTMARHATASGQHVLTVAVKGTAASVGKVVRASITDPATGQTTVSAPVPLQPWWQTVGVTATTTGSPLAFAVVEQAAGGLSPGQPWSAGDTWLVDTVQARAQGPTVATTQGRQLLVDGAPYAMTGYNYGAQPVGSAGVVPSAAGIPVNWHSNPAQCQSDANLMQAAGVNTLRITFLEVYDDNAYECMDAFHAAGVGLLWLVNGPQTVQTPDPTLLEPFWLTLSRVVEAVKDHPATLGYVIGNENGRQNPSSQPGWLGMLDELARRTKQADPHHVTTTSMNSQQFLRSCADNFCWDGVHAGLAPNVDLWGFNHYGSATGYPAGLWQVIIDQDPSRPVWISEFGTDRYRCLPHEPGFGLQIALNLLTCDLEQGSGEDPLPQADWDAAAWSDIAANLSVDDPDGAVVGGTLFMWSDMWWFSFPIFTGGVTTPATHDVQGVACVNPVTGDRNFFACNRFPDGHFSPEWIGSGHALSLDHPGPRVTMPAYDRMAGLYTGAPGPVVANAQVASVGACTATLTWTTDVPTFSRVDFGSEAMVAAGPAVYADNYLADQHVETTVLTTNHTVSLSGLAPGVSYRAFARGFDEQGRSGTSLALSFTTTPGADQGCLP